MRSAAGPRSGRDGPPEFLAEGPPEPEADGPKQVEVLRGVGSVGERTELQFAVIIEGRSNEPEQSPGSGEALENGFERKYGAVQANNPIQATKTGGKSRTEERGLRKQPRFGAGVHCRLSQS